MAELSSYMRNFREFQDYWFDLQERTDAYGSPIEGDRLDSDGFEPHELMGHSVTALGDPGWAIYEDIHEYGEAEVVQFLVEDAIENDSPEKAGVYWNQFQKADSILRNPEEELFPELNDSGMSEEEINHVREQYEQHVEPLLDGSMFEE